MKLLMRTGNDAGALFMRLALAAAIWPHGAQKVLGWYGGAGFQATIDNFQQWFQMSKGLTMCVMAAEFLGPIALALGLLGRVAALGIGIVMAGAAWKVHWPHFFMNWTGALGADGKPVMEGVEYHILAVGLCLGLLIRGSGALSVDRALSKE